MRTGLVAAALGLSTIATIILAVMPTGTSVEGGQVIHSTLIDVNGSWVVGLLGIPIMISAVPLMIPTRQALVAATALLWAFVVVGSFSVGLFYIPAAVAMLLAAGVKPPRDLPT
ncbi:MAG TPA: hypothetical protein VKX45_15950 [Bryobacteraceae bacterium]|jgi:hypothetical protein|nr:hypothetical protein [Bryobacteraceae bacterium]